MNKKDVMSIVIIVETIIIIGFIMFNYILVPFGDAGFAEKPYWEEAVWVNDELNIRYETLSGVECVHQDNFYVGEKQMVLLFRYGHNNYVGLTTIDEKGYVGDDVVAEGNFLWDGNQLVFHFKDIKDEKYNFLNRIIVFEKEK